jgi:hypothetical protein
MKKSFWKPKAKLESEKNLKNLNRASSQSNPDEAQGCSLNGKKRVDRVKGFV